GSAGGLTAASNGDAYMFPNGPSAAYYVDSSFVSSRGYGFLLARDEIVQWRLAYDRADAWQVGVAAPAIDYLVAPGTPPRALRTLTAVTGRQPVAPAWALGSIFDRLVKYPSDPPEQHTAEVAGDL